MGQSVKDETKEYCQKLTEECTKQVKEVIKQIVQHNLQEAENGLQQLLLTLGIRGFLTMLGFRKTIGTQDIPWPSSNLLLENFNRAN